MPHFTLQISSNGPLLNAFVGVSQARSTALVAAGQTVPNVVQIRALVDTGASSTCIDPSVLQGLNLTPTGNVGICTPSSGATPHTVDQYDVSLLVPGAGATDLPLVIENLPVISAELLVAQGFHALIGRDILSRCLLTYNGSIGLFTLAY